MAWLPLTLFKQHVMVQQLWMSTLSVLRISSCQYFLCTERLFFISFPPHIDGAWVSALCAQDDTEILFQQNKRAVNL